MARVAETRTALVEQAERLFAERGIEAVSLRDVSAAAGQRNHSAAQYHFGDRAGLVAAVYESRMRVVNEWRQLHLEQLEADDRLVDAAGLVAAIVIPLVQLVTTTPCWYARFLARVRWDRFAANVVADLPAASTIRRTNGLLLQALLPLPLETRRSRVDQLVTLTVGTLAGWEAARHDNRRRLPAAALAGELLSTTVAVVTAPPPTTAPTARSRGGTPTWQPRPVPDRWPDPESPPAPREVGQTGPTNGSR